MPFDVPKGWVWTTLGEIAESNIGLTYKPSDICNDGVPVYRSNNIQGVKIDTTDLVRVQTTILDKQFLKEGDLLICARNGSRRLVGKNAIIRKLTEKTAFGAFMAVCRSKYNPWLHLLLQTSYFDKYLDESNSTAINQVTQSMLLALNTPLPPLAEQQRIVAEIERWFALIDIIEQGKVNLQTAIKQMKSKILDLAIHGKLVPQDASDEPASELLKRINPKAQITCDNEHSEKLPKGWYLSTLGDCFKWGSGGTPESTVKAYYEGNIPWLVIGDLNDSIVTFASKHISQLGIYNSSAKVLTKGTLLMAMYGSIGKLGIAGMELATNQAIAYAKPNEINTYYLFYYLLANRDNFYMLGKGGTQKNISQTLIKSYPFLLPPLAEQKRIVLKIEELFSIIDTVEQTLQA